MFGIVIAVKIMFRFILQKYLTWDPLKVMSVQNVKNSNDNVIKKLRSVIY